MDYGKHRFEANKKAREARKKESRITVKQVKLRPNIDDHDLQTKLNHARRFLVKEEWTDLVIPFADFTCIVGAGEYAPWLTEQRPLTGEEMIAVLFLVAFPRAGRGEAIITVDNIAAVQVPGEPDELRSFWQVPDVSQVHLKKDPRYPGRGGMTHMLPKGKDVPLD